LQCVQEIDSVLVRPARHCTMLKPEVNLAFEIPTRNGYQKTETQSHSLHKFVCCAGSVGCGFRSDSLRDPIWCHCTTTRNMMSSENLTQDQSHRKERVQRRYNPYLLKDTRCSSSGGSKTCTKTLTKHLLQTLTDDSNPITHSDIGLRSGQFSYSVQRAKHLTLDAC